MADTIREQIIQAVEDKLAVITTANGFATDLGESVIRGRTHIDPDGLPVLAIWPGAEEAAKIVGAHVILMSVRLEAIMAVGAEDPSAMANAALGDMIQAMCGGNGDGAELTLDGALAGPAVTSVVVNESIPSGVAASGHIRIRRASKNYTKHAYSAWTAKTFTIEATDFSSDNAPDNGAVYAANSAIETTTGGLGDEIAYQSGGVESWPAEGQKILGVPANFIIKFRIKIGDPYSQP